MIFCFLIDRERRTKDDVQIYENGTISYHELRNYTFERFESCETCDESTVVNTMNIVYMVNTIISILKSYKLIFYTGISQLSSNRRCFTSISTYCWRIFIF